MKTLSLIVGACLIVSGSYAQFLNFNGTATAASNDYTGLIARQGKIRLNSTSWDDHLEISRGGYGATFMPDHSPGYQGLRLQMMGAISNFYILDGNVGIGTTAPDEKLAVKGKVHAQEIKVDLSGAIAPDYVFQEDYKLPSLETVKSYINQNHHLPEIPSAKEMDVNGIELKEMNLLLLKKIEELTLYVIEQQEEINVLKSKIK